MGINKFELYEETRQRGVGMLKDDKPVAKIAAALGVSRQTVYNWIKRGFGEQAKIKPGGRPPKLNERQRAELREIIQRGPSAYGFGSGGWTGERIAKVIRERFGVTFNPKSVPQMLRHWGWEWRWLHGDTGTTAIAGIGSESVQPLPMAAKGQ